MIGQTDAQSIKMAVLHTIGQAMFKSISKQNLIKKYMNQVVQVYDHFR